MLNVKKYNNLTRFQAKTFVSVHNKRRDSDDNDQKIDLQARVKNQMIID